MANKSNQTPPPATTQTPTPATTQHAQTGPTSEAGKLISSQNAAIHYMTARALLVKDEDPEAWKQLLLHWHNSFPTEDQIATDLVNAAASSDWLLRRNQRGFDLTMQKLYQRPESDWTDADHAQYQRTQRYLTTAQRRLDRDRTALLQFLREKRAQRREAQADALTTQKQAALQKAPTPALTTAQRLALEAATNPNPSPIRQDIEISSVNGITKTVIQPTNEIVLNCLDRLVPVPPVRRYLTIMTRIDSDEYDYLRDLTDTNTYSKLLTPKEFRLAVERDGDGPVLHWPNLHDKPG